MAADDVQRIQAEDERDRQGCPTEAFHETHAEWASTRVLKFEADGCQAVYRSQGDGHRSSALPEVEVDRIRYGLEATEGDGACGAWAVIGRHSAGATDEICGPDGSHEILRPGEPLQASFAFGARWTTSQTSTDDGVGLLDWLEVVEVPGDRVEGEAPLSRVACLEDGFGTSHPGHAIGDEALRYGYRGCTALYDTGGADAVGEVRYTVSGLGPDPVCGSWWFLDGGEVVATTERACPARGEFVRVDAIQETSLSGAVEAVWMPGPFTPAYANGVLDYVGLE